MLRISVHTLIIFTVLALSACDKSPQLAPLSSHAVVLAFGDSLTFGTGASPENSYPAQLESLIDRKVINAGVPGEVSATGLARLPILLDRHQPQLVILCHGGNDILRRHSLKRTQQNLQKMVELILARKAQVVLVAVPEFGVFLSAAPFYGELAQLNQLPLINDTLSDILANNSLKADQIHPNAGGYRLLAESINTLLIDTGAI